jgi:hypothetical protein
VGEKPVDNLSVGWLGIWRLLLTKPLEQKRELISADANDRGSALGLLGSRETLVACADKPILERLSPVTRFTWREPCHHDKEEPSDDDERREPEQTG